MKKKLSHHSLIFSFIVLFVVMFPGQVLNAAIINASTMTANQGSLVGVIANLNTADLNVVTMKPNANLVLSVNISYPVSAPGALTLVGKVKENNALNTFNIKVLNSSGTYTQIGAIKGSTAYQNLNLSINNAYVINGKITVRITGSNVANLVVDLLTLNNETAVPGTITVQPQSSTAIFNNPERGFHNFEDLSVSTAQLQANVAAGSTLDIIVVNLGAFKTAPLSSTFLSQYTALFGRARTAGVKLILLHKYHDQADFSSDPAESIMLGHIAQLGPIITANADVVYTVHAGFIGAWGEWYYTQHPLAVRENVLKALLNALPASLTVGIRTPALKINIFGMTGPNLPGSDAALAKRVGHHNDCFLASADDFGTGSDYLLSNPADWRDFIGQENKALSIPVGGETCAVSSFSVCSNALVQMRRQGYSYLNIDYHPNVISSWKTGGCFDEINRNLGYRLKVNKFTIPAIISRTAAFNINMDIENVGYAGFVNPRPLKLVIFNDTNSYIVDLNVTQRFVSGVTNIAKSIDLSALNVAVGSYKVALFMPDKAAGLQAKPGYSVQFANQSTWDSVKGWNILKDSALANLMITIAD